MIDWGFKAQRLGEPRARRVRVGADARGRRRRPASRRCASRCVHFVNKKMPGGLPKKTARALLDIEDRHYVPIIRDPARTTSESEAVFYFPGCGSERLFSQVGLATQAMLWHVGVQTVLPPGYLCCGYPQRGAGQFDKAEKIITDNRVLFHRVANTLNYLDIKTVVVSCGTCYDQLQGYKFDEIFPGCRIIDIHEYLMERGVQLEGVTGVRYMYHDPCHSPMKQHDPLKVVNTLMNDAGQRQDREERSLLRRVRHVRGDAARHRDAGALPQGAGNARRAPSKLRADGFKGEVKVLTSCPSCLQGLKRYNDDADIDADYIVVEIARHVLGADWLPEYVQGGEQRRYRAGAGVNCEVPASRADAAIGIPIEPGVASSCSRRQSRRPLNVRSTTSSQRYQLEQARAPVGKSAPDGASRSGSWSAGLSARWSANCAEHFPDIEFIAARPGEDRAAGRRRRCVVRHLLRRGAGGGQVGPLDSFRDARESRNCVSVPAVRERDILVTNMQRIGGPIIAEHVMAMTLAFTRGLDCISPAQAKHEWQRVTPPGRMAVVEARPCWSSASAASAAKSRSARMRMEHEGIATRASGRTGPDFVSYVGLPDELPKLAAEADFVVNTAPLTPQTPGIFDAAFFSRMKPSGVLHQRRPRRQRRSPMRWSPR